MGKYYNRLFLDCYSYLHYCRHFYCAVPISDYAGHIIYLFHTWSKCLIVFLYLSKIYKVLGTSMWQTALELNAILLVSFVISI
ncbi:hypothetical protein BGW37DRAFT_479727 [Umbelopsis sp. PMI_123]|nr:hypothetical protein BGW37DRAFT_479727 [Umbelopsis sp. PMI_123]